MACAAATLFGLPRLAGIPTMLLGPAGITASAFNLPGSLAPRLEQPAHPRDFHLTGLLLGPLFLRALGVEVPPLLIAAFPSLQLVNQLLKLLRLFRSDEFELKAADRLLSQDLGRVLIARLGLLVLGGIALTLAWFPKLAFVATLAGELAGRYLFFVSVVPRNMALPWLSQGASTAFSAACQANLYQGCRIMTRTYSLVTEGYFGSYSAYVPELPAILLTGNTMDELTIRAREAIQIYWETLESDRSPTASMSEIEVDLSVLT